ncbi:DUF4910 domain-containing protein [Thermococcus sp.]
MKRFLKEAGVFDGNEVLHYIEGISQFHRIQGSRELVEAVKFIKNELGLWGIRADFYRETYDGKKRYLTLTVPIAWNLVRASVEVLNERFTSSTTPLIAMAHSPSGEVEGEVIPILRESDWENAEGKIVLVGFNWREAYKRANNSGAIGFIAYREGTGRAFPYIGLFLRRKDLSWARIPAVTLPEDTAKKIISKINSGESVKAKITVEAETPERETLPILYARIGKPPYLLFTAHICHPKPGANDNASGSAALIELARILNGLYDDSFRLGFAFLWVPEYYGTQAFIERYANLDEYYAVINLDMIAGSEDRAGSTIMLVREPLSRFSILSGLIEYYIDALNKNGTSFSGSALPMFKFKSYAYEMGSDHDVFNFFGIPGTMPITWPDRFYHSSEDTIEKLSRETLEIIGKAVLATALALAKGSDEELGRFARGHAMKYLGELSRDRNTEVAERLVMIGLARDSKFIGIKSGHDFKREGWLKWEPKGMISEDYISSVDEELGKEFKRLTEERRTLPLLHEFLMLSELLPEKEAFKALQEELGEFEKEKLRKLVEILEKTGMVRKV